MDPMTDEAEASYIAALIELHRGLPRQGPGDRELALSILDRLPPLPEYPRIADLGCGTGAGALLLARRFGSRVLAVDTSQVFLNELRANATRAGLADLIEPVCADMGALDRPPASIDLLWSEGAAYNLGFETALRSWRPLLADGGVAVVSDASWFDREAPERLRRFWEAAYPTMGTEEENRRRAERAGFRVLFSERLPAAAWWESYYGPLQRKMDGLDPGDLHPAVVEDTKQEIALFERYSDVYGYTFYALAAEDAPS